MPLCVKKVTQFKVQMEDRPGQLAEIARGAANEGINFLAMTGYPREKGRAEIIGVPEDADKAKRLAANAGISVETAEALLITGDDKLGAVAVIAEKVAALGVNIKACDAMAVEGKFALWLYVAPADLDKVAEALAADCCKECK